MTTSFGIFQVVTSYGDLDIINTQVDRHFNQQAVLEAPFFKNLSHKMVDCFSK